MLRTLGFLDQSNTPTPTYSLLKGKGEVSKGAIAEGIKKAYAPLFNANESADELTGDKLKSLISQVAGVDDDMTARIASTFSALVKQGNFSIKTTVDQSAKQEEVSEQAAKDASETKANYGKGLRAEFQYVIQIQLPSNGSEETYLNIFNAIRKTFQ